MLPAHKIDTEARSFIATFGRKNFAFILAKTSMTVRSDRRLIGFAHLRDIIEFESALRAAGLTSRPLSFGKVVLDQETMDVAEDLFKKAVESAQHA